MPGLRFDQNAVRLKLTRVRCGLPTTRNTNQRLPNERIDSCSATERCVAVADYAGDLQGIPAKKSRSSSKTWIVASIFSLEPPFASSTNCSFVDKYCPNLRCGNYAFRHMNITELSRLGVPLKTIQKRVGHATGSDVTMEPYIHAVDADDLAAADALGALLSPKGTQPVES